MRKLLYALPILCVVAVSVICFAFNTPPAHVVNAKVKTPPPIVVGQFVFPSSYYGTPDMSTCGWQDGDGQPFPFNPYSRSSDWIGQLCRVVAIYNSCAVIEPVSPVVPGSFSIWWPVAYL